MEDSPLAKVNVLKATMEALGQGSPDKADRPTETRRLKISWPPRTEPEDSHSVASTTTEVCSANRPIRAKWPPEEDSPSSPPEQAKEVSCLRRSASLKERSMPFTVAGLTGNSPAPEAKKQSPPPPPPVDERQLSPEPTSMELQHSGQSSHSHTPIEDSCVDVHASSGEDEEEEQEVKSEDLTDHHLPNEEDTPAGNTEQEEEEVNMEEEDGVLEEEMSPLKSQEVPAEPTTLSSPEGEVESSRSPQDVGFWDSEEMDDKGELEQQEALTVEEMIKRNRYYEEEEDV